MEQFSDKEFDGKFIQRLHKRKTAKIRMSIRTAKLLLD